MAVKLTEKLANFVEAIAKGDALSYRPDQEEIQLLQQAYFQSSKMLGKPAEWNMGCGDCKIRIMQDIYTAMIKPQRNLSATRIVKRVTPEEHKPLGEMTRKELFAEAKKLGKTVPANARKEEVIQIIRG